MSTLHSMTGFGSVEAELPDGRSVTVRVKAVNGRHLELQLRLPPALELLEPEVRALVKAAVRRGNVDVTIHMERNAAAGAPELDEALLAGHLAAHRLAAERFGICSEPDLNVLLRLPGVMSTAVRPVTDDALLAAVRTAVSEALQQLSHTRALEGAALASELRAGMTRLQATAEEAAALRRQVSVTAVDRLRSRLLELTGEHVELPPERILAEAALLVARGDVEEELVRLRTHLQRFTTLLDTGGEAGKPLEFLLQELGRETNTLLSKTGGAAGEAGLRLTDLGLAMKVELERAREQVMNLE